MAGNIRTDKRRRERSRRLRRWTLLAVVTAMAPARKAARAIDRALRALRLKENSSPD